MELFGDSEYELRSMSYFEPSTPPPAQIASWLFGSDSEINELKPIRLDGGSTNAVYLVTLAPSGVKVVLKVSTEGSDTPLFENRPQTEWRLLCALSTIGVAPMPISKLSLGDGEFALAYHFVEGKLGARSPSALAGVLRTTHESSPVFSLQTRVMNAPDLLVQSDQLLSVPLPKWAVALKPKRPVQLPKIKPRLIHSDPIFNNIVTDKNGKTVLIDWQCPALGDPLEDIAHATSTGMAEAYSAPPPFDVWDVLEEYGEQSLTMRASSCLPLYSWRMLCYCHWQASQGHTRYAAAVEHEAGLLDRLNSKNHK